MAGLRQIGIVGASLAGLRTAEALRAPGCDAAIVVIGAEDQPPCNRPSLSKQFLTTPMDPRELALPTRHYLDVEWRLGVRATGLDRNGRRIETTQGPVCGLDVVVVVTGATARTLPFLPRPGLHVLRTVSGALALRASLGRAARWPWPAPASSAPRWHPAAASSACR